MSVCGQCVKTTADSNDKYDKTMFLDLYDLYIEYNIFSTEQSIVESNSEEQKINCDNISTKLCLMKLK